MLIGAENGVFSVGTVGDPKSTAYLSFGGIFAAFVLDVATGPDLGLSLLYVIPVVGAAHFGSRRMGLVGALLAALATVAAEVHGATLIRVALISWNGLSRLGVFSTVALLAASWHSERSRLSELSLALEQALERERQLSRTDPLTGLPNGRAFHEALDTELARSARSKLPLGVAYIDVNDFKLFNDAGGHAVGDRALQSVAATLSKVLRVGDTAGRLGGDEFAVIVTDASVISMQRIAKRVAETLASLPELVPGISLSVSMGAVVCGGGDFKADALLRAADGAMYRAKAKKGTVRGPLEICEMGGAAD